VYAWYSDSDACFRADKFRQSTDILDLRKEGERDVAALEYFRMNRSEE
jgi:hypothetical protein